MLFRSAVQALAAAGVQTQGTAIDVADGGGVARVLGEHPWAQAADVLVNNAGVMSQRTAKTLRTDADEWRRVMAVNLDGVFHMTAAVVPAMAERRRGRVINVSACLGRFSGPGLAGATSGNGRAGGAAGSYVVGISYANFIISGTLLGLSS